MAYGAKVVLDSISDAGVRLTTLEVTMPRIVLAEFNTHRVFSRNAASSRAIPVAKQIKALREDPFIPQRWAKNQKGMVAGSPLDEAEREEAVKLWLEVRDIAIAYAEKLGDPDGLNIHKQWTNRLLEPWMWVTDIVTATEYENFKGLRVSPEAQPDFEVAARMMDEAQKASTPRYIKPGEWHLPYVTNYDEDQLRSEITTGAERVLAALKRSENPVQIQFYAEEIAKIVADQTPTLVQISAGRCARVSYLTHDGKRDWQEDVALYGKLLGNRHLSPLEHPAMALANPIPIGNFVGWMQQRKWVPGEAIYRKEPK